MKKIVFVFAFALVAAFSYAAYTSVELNTETISIVEEEPKAEEAKAETTESTEKSETADTEKKSECTTKKKSSCSKSCGGGN